MSLINKKYPSIEKMETDTHIYFWGDQSPLSNFYQPIKIAYDGNTFTSSEQFYMYYKALFFGDTHIAERILKTDKQYMAKQLGREVSGFNETMWNTVKEDIMFNVVLMKFTLNEGVKHYLKSTGNKVLVEASPYDRVWGIGLYPTDPLVLDEKNWLGENLLGKVLMEVRDVLFR